MPKFSQKQLDVLGYDQVFAERVKTDAVLNQLFSEKDQDRGDQVNELVLGMGGDIVLKSSKPRVKQVKFKPPCIGTVSMLGVVDSPFLPPRRNPKVIDVDRALYILINQEEAFSDCQDIDAQLDPKCAGTCARLGVDYDNTAVAIYNAVTTSFSPLRMLPEQLADEGKLYWDSYWATSLISNVAPYLNAPFEEIRWRVPLITVLFFHVQHLRLSGMKGISRRTKAGDCKARLDELMKIRLEELKCQS